MGIRQGFKRLKVLILELEGSRVPFLRIWELQWASLFCGEEAKSGGTEPPDRH